MKNSSDADMTLILFTVGGYTCAVDMVFLAEVTEPLPSTPLPFVPDYVDGLINIGGQIMPQLNIMRLLQTDTEKLQTLLILQVHGVPLALRVNQILDTVVYDEPVKKLDDDMAAWQTFLAGQCTLRGQQVLLLDAEKLTDLIKAGKKTSGKPGFLGQLKQSHQTVEKSHDFLLFQVAGTDYAFALADVDEIIELQSLTAQPKAPAVVAGISLIRSEPRVILNLSTILDQHEYGDGQIAVMVNVDGQFYGLLIDRLTGIESIAEQHIRYSADKQQQTLQRADHSLVQVLHVRHVLSPYLPDIQPFTPATRHQDQRQIKQIEFLRFLVNGDAYAFQISHIKRVITDKQIEPLLKSQAWIIGTTDIDGRVIPVVDLMAQLGYQSRPEQLREYIVVHDGQSEWALAIQLSEQIIAVDETRIDPIAENNARYVKAFVSENQQLLTILDPLTICRDNQLQQNIPV